MAHMLVQEGYALSFEFWGALNSGEMVEKFQVAKFGLRSDCEITFQSRHSPPSTRSLNDKPDRSRGLEL